jgi:hypothetical protein
MKKILLLICAIIPALCFAQKETYDIKNPSPEFAKNCQRCLQVMNSKPAEVHVAVMRDESNSLYFYLTNPAWFDKFFQKSGDGVTVDIVSRKQYSCYRSSSRPTWSGKGTLLKPVYLKDLKKNQFLNADNHLVVKIGEVPENLRNTDLEFNIVFLTDKYFCHTFTAINIPQFKWDLLDMGMYMDTITYKEDLISRDSSTTYHIHSKRLKFVVPFEKNKSDFSPADVKPIYDSLNMTDYYISRIDIRAYSSVEGSEEKNTELQTKRSESLIKALQSYQKESIKTRIETSENWVEFLNDITGTPYQYLSTLSKQEVKKKLEDKMLAQALESYLSTHRKGVLIFEMERKNELKKMSAPALKSLFDKSIADKNLKRASEIQEAIFDKIKDHDAPDNFLDQLEIPRQSAFGPLLNNQYAFSMLMDQKDIYEGLLAFEDLRDLFPEDGKIRYNIVTLKFRAWLEGRSDIVNPAEFKKEIENLRKYKIPALLITRMLINYNIIHSEQAMAEHNYVQKDNDLKYIYNNYSKVATRPADILSLSQYFVAYTKYDWALKILDPYVKAIDGDEDLIFYYVTLSLLQPNITSKPDYRKIMLNAINMNRKRFCQMFDANGQGGVSFQLLEDDFLRKGYCENCVKEK